MTGGWRWWMLWSCALLGCAGADPGGAADTGSSSSNGASAHVPGEGGDDDGAREPGPSRPRPAVQCEASRECEPGERCVERECTPAVGVCATAPAFDPAPWPRQLSGPASAIAVVQADPDAAVEVMLSNDAGLWLIDAEAEPTSLGPGGHADLVIADLDGDADEDAVGVRIDERGIVALEVLARGPAGYTVVANLEGTPTPAAVGDLDGDGDEELFAVAAQRDAFAVSVLLADGPALLADATPLVDGLDLPYLAVGRFDDDDAADVAGHVPGRTRVWRGPDAAIHDGDGNVLDFLPTPPSLGLFFVPFAGDGEWALLSAHASASETTVAVLSFDAHAIALPIVATLAVAADLEGDGVHELLLTGGGSLGVVAGGEPECIAVTQIDVEPTAFAVGDVDGDGLVDLVLTHDAGVAMLRGRP